MPQTLYFRAPSAALLTVELDSAAPVSTSATDAHYVGGLSTYTLQMGTPGFQEVANEAVMPATIVDRFVVDGREVRLAIGNEGVNATAAMIGEWHEAMLVYGGPPPSRTEVIEAFTQFSFDDRPEGMAAMPRPGTGLELYMETVKIVAEDRGSISVLGQRTSRGVVPLHAGASTRYGEVWRVEGQLPDREGDGANTYLYIIGTPTAVAEVVFDFEPTVDDVTLLTWLDSINLVWN